MRIGATHPVRKDIVNLPNYFGSLPAALNEINIVLNKHRIVAESASIHGGEGRALLNLFPAENEIVCSCGQSATVFDNWLVLYWYTLQSGTVEVTTYVS